MNEEVKKYMSEIGRKGGNKNTPAQVAARKKPKCGAGRPVGKKIIYNDGKITISLKDIVIK